MRARDVAFGLPSQVKVTLVSTKAVLLDAKSGFFGTRDKKEAKLSFVVPR